MNTKRNNIKKFTTIIKKRPLNKKDIQNKELDIIEVKHPSSVIVKELKNKIDMSRYIEEHLFEFDRCFDEYSTNHEVYLEVVQPLVREAFSKIKITCFSYGQTGSGKTFTMMGHESNNQSLEENSGLILLTAHDIFSYLCLDQFSHLEIYVSFYEIYCEKVFDLLNERNAVLPLEDKNNTVNLKNLTEQQVWNETDLTRVVKKGLKARTVGVTGANSDSSRSHALIEINIREPEGKNFSKIVFVDLAGTERAVDVIETNKQTRFDTGKINEGLFALKECIRALRANSAYIPFRKNPLTFVLKDYFCSQKTKMVMITNITPTIGSVEYTLNSLRYAKMLKNDRLDETTIKYDVYEKVAQPNKIAAVNKEENIKNPYSITNKFLPVNENTEKNNQNLNLTCKTQNSKNNTNGNNPLKASSSSLFNLNENNNNNNQKPNNQKKEIKVEKKINESLISNMLKQAESKAFASNNNNNNNSNNNGINSHNNYANNNSNNSSNNNNFNFNVNFTNNNNNNLNPNSKNNFTNTQSNFNNNLGNCKTQNFMNTNANTGNNLIAPKNTLNKINNNFNKKGSSNNIYSLNEDFMFNVGNSDQDPLGDFGKSQNFINNKQSIFYPLNPLTQMNSNNSNVNLLYNSKGFKKNNNNNFNKNLNKEAMEKNDNLGFDTNLEQFYNNNYNNNNDNNNQNFNNFNSENHLNNSDCYAEPNEIENFSSYNNNYTNKTFNAINVNNPEFDKEEIQENDLNNTNAYYYSTNSYNTSVNFTSEQKNVESEYQRVYEVLEQKKKQFREEYNTYNQRRIEFQKLHYENLEKINNNEPTTESTWEFMERIIELEFVYSQDISKLLKEIKEIEKIKLELAQKINEFRKIFKN